MSKSKGLTPKQQRFVEEFMVDLNATQAYLRAGYSVHNSNVARANASRLLTRANIQAALQADGQALAKRTGVSQATVIRGLYAEATNTGEGSSHSARVAAWAHLADRLWPVPKEKDQPPAAVTNIQYNVTFVARSRDALEQSVEE